MGLSRPGHPTRQNMGGISGRISAGNQLLLDGWNAEKASQYEINFFSRPARNPLTGFAVPLRIQCSSCGHQGTVPDTYLGKEILCPACRGRLVPLTPDKMENF